MKYSPSIVVVTLLALLNSPVSFLHATPPPWQNVAIGGGGAVTDIVADPNTANMFYMKTDIGGAYRWDATDSQWIPLTDGFSNSSGGQDFGMECVAVDPNIAGTVYLYTGMYSYSGYVGKIFKSTDYGDTWTQWGHPASLQGDSNGTDHSRRGPKLAVDPNNSSVVYLASLNVGFNKTVNAGSTWTAFTGVPNGQAAYGLSFVAIDKGGGTTSVSGVTVSSIVYVGVYDTATGTTDGGVWKTTNGGGSWTQMTGGFNCPARGVVASDGTFYVTFLSAGGVCKAARTATALTNIAPTTTDSYGGLAADPNNAQTIFTSVYSTSSNSKTYRSTTGGVPTTSWTALNTVQGTQHLATRDSTSWFAHISNIAVNPANSSDLWMADWSGVLENPTCTSGTAAWNYLWDGDEELVPLDLVSAPTGAPLVSADADANGEQHVSLTTAPTESFIRSTTPANFGSSTSVDFCEATSGATTFWARVWTPYGDAGTGGGDYSTNDGATWTPFASTPSSQSGGRIAVSASNSNVMVWQAESGNTYFTTNKGSSWTSVSVPGRSTSEFSQGYQQLTSDRVTADTFYYLQDNYTAGIGTLYVITVNESTNTATVTTAGTVSYASRSSLRGYTLMAEPKVAGELWLSVSYTSNIYKLNWSGTALTSTALANALNGSISFGAPAPGHTNPSAYLRGTAVISGTDYSGIFRSDDDGSTWVEIDDPSTPINDGATVISGDRQVWGRCYVATDGRGIYYNEVLPDGWTGQDIDSPALPGSAVFDGTTWTISGAGADIWSYDQFNLCSTAGATSQTISAKLTSETDANYTSKVGLMMRNDTTDTSAYVDIFVTPGSKVVAMQYRPTDGGSPTGVGTSFSYSSLPIYIKLVRVSGGAITGSYSTNGTSWTALGTATPTFGSATLTGMMVCSRNTTTLETATYTNVTVTSP